METQRAAMQAAVAGLTAAGQPFELNRIEQEGVSYRNYATLPQNLRDYYAMMSGHGDKDFVVYGNERYSFAQGYALAAAFAAALRDDYGISKGDRVAIASRNNPQWMMAFMAITALGAVAVPINAWWTTDELDYGLGDSGASVVIVDRQRAERVAPLVESRALRLIGVEDCTDLAAEIAPFGELVEKHQGAAMPEVELAPEDFATIMYTSGSTGHPKGALSSHRGVVSALYSWVLMGVAALQVTGEESANSSNSLPPVGLLTVPLFHCTASHSAFLLSLMIGRTLVIMHKWDAQEALRLIEQEKITWMTGVPTMTAELQQAALTTERDISSLKDIFSGGAARPPDQVDKLAKTFKNSSPGIGYGLTETNALGAVNNGAMYLSKPGSTGVAVPAVTDIAILDEQGNELPAGERGEVCIKSPANCLGYWNKPEATRDAFINGWFHTGDVGYLDEDGFLYIVDRIKDIIIRGGENISCLEVEAAIYQHPAVDEAAVFGVPDDRLGEAVAAAVVLQADAELEATDLQQFLADSLAAFKIPQYIDFRTEQLPRIASGKIFKRALKAHYSDLLNN